MIEVIKPDMWCPGIVPAGHPLRTGLAMDNPMWKGPPNSTTMDVSGNSNPGTFVNTPTWCDTPYGRGIDLDGGTQRLDYPVTITPATYTQNTLLICTKIDVVEKAALAGKDINTESGGGCYDTDGIFRWYVSGVGRRWTSNAGFWVASEWATVAMVYNGGLVDADKLRVYKNGVLIVPSTINIIATSLTRNATAFSIGYDVTAVDAYAWGYWNGQFAYAAMWDRALAAYEIEWLYREPWAMNTMPDDLPAWVGATMGGAAPPAGSPYYYNMISRQMRDVA